MNYCETCKHFQHTGVSSDGKPYELGGKCEVKPPTRWQGDYCNGGGSYDPEDGLWKPDKNGFGMAHVFDELNKLYGRNPSGKVSNWEERQIGGKYRAKNRSKTFPGIAKAIAEQWSAYLEEI